MVTRRICAACGCTVTVIYNEPMPEIPSYCVQCNMRELEGQESVLLSSRFVAQLEVAQFEIKYSD